MSEEWKKEFFEWKDEIESKYNEILESRIKYENKIEALKKKQKHDFNKLLWIKMIPYKEWFWGLKMFVEEQIAEIMKKLTWLSDENAKLYTQVDDDALKRAKLEEVLQKTLKKLADVGISGFIDEKLLEKLDSKKEYKYFDFDTKEYSWGKYYDLGIIESKNLGIKDSKQTEKKEVYIPPNINLEDIKETDLFDNQEDSGGEKEDRLKRFKLGMTEEEYKKYKKDENWGYQDEKLPEPISLCNDCKFEGRASNQLPCWECDEYNLFEPKEKTEPEKGEVVEPFIDLWEKNTITVTCPFCHNSYYLAPKKIEERVRGATRKELIEGFSEKLEFLRDKVLEAPIISGSVQDLRDHTHDIKDLVVKNIEEYEGMLK